MEESKKGDITQAIALLVKVAIIIVAIVGIASLAKTIIKTVAFDKYPLQAYETTTAGADGKNEPLPSDQLDTLRKQHLIDDYITSVTMMLVAGGMYLVIKKKG